MGEADLICQDDKAGSAALELGADGDRGLLTQAMARPGTPSASSANGLVPSGVSVTARIA
jgi:hypothetical protein